MIHYGMIVAFHGNDDVPENWRLCDGNNGTPNLTNRFILGATGNNYTTPPVTGGNQTITLQARNLPPHTHNTYFYNDDFNGTGGNRSLNGLEDDTNNGNSWNIRPTDGGNELYSTPINIMPPYYILRYIMFIGNLKNYY